MVETTVSLWVLHADTKLMPPAEETSDQMRQRKDRTGSFVLRKRQIWESEGGFMMPKIAILTITDIDNAIFPLYEPCSHAAVNMCATHMSLHTFACKKTLNWGPVPGTK